MPGDIEKRLRVVEDDHKEQRLLYHHMCKTLDSISADIRLALDLKGKVEDHNGQLKKLWDKIDKCVEMKEAFLHLRSEHDICKPKTDHISLIEHRLTEVEEKVSGANNFVTDRVASFTDKLIWVAAGVIAFGAVFGAAYSLLKVVVK